LSVILVCLVVAHFLVFAPLSGRWSQATTQLEEKVRTVDKMMGQGLISLDQPSLIRESRNQIKKQLAALNDLKKHYLFEEQALASTPVQAPPDYRESIIERLHKIEEFQAASETTKVRLLQGWGIDDALAEGRFGGGYHASAGKYCVFPADDGMVNKGTVEFLFKPLWSPLEDIEARTLASFVGFDTTASTKDEDNPPFCAIEVLKTPRTLLLQLKNYEGLSEEVACSIETWQRDEWHHIAVTWNKETGEASLHVDERLVGSAMAGSARKGAGRAGMPRFGGNEFGEFGERSMMATGANRGFRRGSRSEDMGPRVLPSMTLLDALYLGADRNGERTADGVFDELRISNTNQGSFDSKKALAQDESTVLLRHFDKEYAPASSDELMRTLGAMESKLMYQKDNKFDKHILKRYVMEYEILRRSLGIDVATIEKGRPGNGIYALEELYLADYIRQSLPSLSLNHICELLGFKLPREMILRNLASFLDISQWIANKAVEEKISEVTEVRYVGDSDQESDDTLWADFEKALKELQEEYPPDKRQLGLGGMMGAGMSPEMGFDPGMMAEMGAMGGMPYAMAPLSPAEQARQEGIKKVQKWEEAQRRGEIPAQFRTERAAGHNQQGVYLKRQVRIFFESNVEQLADLLYDLEGGEYLATVDKLNVESDEKETLKSAMKIDFHFLAPMGMKDQWLNDSPGSATGEAQIQS